MDKGYIDYSKLIDESMQVIVRKALDNVAENGLQGDHHFYISFYTKEEGVKISDKLLKKYPEEMTIVLQHQFQDLLVGEEHFEVSLSFGGVKEKLVIPYHALTAFADPSVKFGLQFRKNDQSYSPGDSIEDDITPSLDQSMEEEQAEKQTREQIQNSGADNVISLSSLRNNNKKD
jgi:hypothetical protein